MDGRTGGRGKKENGCILKTIFLNSLISIAFQAPVILMVVSVNGSICHSVISLTGL